MEEDNVQYEKCTLCHGETVFEKTTKGGWCLCAHCTHKLATVRIMSVVALPPKNNQNVRSNHV